MSTETLDPNFAPSGETADPRAESAGDTVDFGDPSAFLAALATERDQLAAEKADLHERLLRRTAEFDNFRRRSDREIAERREFASEDAVRNLLPLLDDFELALKSPCSDAEYAKGMLLIYNRFQDSLKKIGLEPMEVQGVKFDPHCHEAIQMVPNADVEDQTILQELRRGYSFKGRLLRPAMVSVAVQTA